MFKLLSAIALVYLCFVCDTQAHAGTIGDILLPGDVIKGHAKIEGQCEKCHKKFDKEAQRDLCKDCHKEVGKDFRDKAGFHGRMKEEKQCNECHTDHKGRDARIVIFDPKKLDHDTETDFPLKGAHLNEKVQCKNCHLPEKKFRDAPSACIGCHKKDDKHKGGLGTDCAKCHSEKDWKTTRFNHDETDFKLLGKHVDVKCKSCHIDDKFKDTPKDCFSCHKKDDKHKAKFGPKCETCHVERAWKEILFDHDRKTDYRLLFKHREVKCASCHKGDLYKDKLKMECNSCHEKDDKHKGKFGPKCETCHVEKGWKEVLFNHDKTDYRLLFKHREVKCVSCHKGDLYKDKLKKDCNSCHENDDKHKGKFGPKCETCHVEKGWKEILFDHDKSTKYKLLFKHKEVKCASCHKDDLYKDKLQMECNSCHEKDDKHKGQEGKKCESCHTEKSWTEADFDHRQSKFPLTGMHVKVECKKCHEAPTFKDAKSDCWSCHEKKDTHKRKFGTLCETCHNTRDWKVWDFDHNKTRFKLEGGHKEVECYKCHQEEMDKKVVLTSICGNCHRNDDVHEGNFGRQCERCHEVTSWKNIKVGGKKL